MSFHPYLQCAGTARAVMEFYAGVFGATDLTINTFAEGPPGAVPPGIGDWVMHSQFSTGPGQWLMACDVPPGMGAPGRQVTIFHNAPDAGAAQRVFDALAEGGQVTMPLSPTFWSAAFGMLTDRFGTSWMVSIPGDGAS